MIKNQHRKTLITIFILFGYFVSLLVYTSIPPQDQTLEFYNDEKFNMPNTALALKYSDIEKNDTYVYRLFETVNFTVNYSNFQEVDHVVMEISFKNGSVVNYDMLSGGVNESYYEFKPGYRAALGLHNVSFLIYDINNTLLNDHTTYTNFTINTNYGATFLPKPEYYIGDTLSADIFLSNFSSSNRDYDFEQWDITIVDGVNEITQQNLLDLEANTNYIRFIVDNETFREVNKVYYLKVNMTELNSGMIRAAYFPFNIINTNPVITSIVNLSHSELFRTDECIVTLNSTDLETAPENLTLTMYIKDSEGDEVLQEVLQYEGGNSFSDKFIIPWYRPVGEYRINVVARDEHGGTVSKEEFFTVKNNAPEIHGYKINGQSMTQSIAVPYGRNLIFSFNVSDTEGVSYIMVALLDQNNNWFNITKAYTGEDTEITIRTIDLITGTWFAYIYVIDSDGAVTSLIDDYNMAPQGITIIPDVLSNFVPWIVFFFGIGIGALLGVGSIYKYFRSKYGESQLSSPKKKEIPIKKKEKVKPIKKELENEEIQEIKSEEEEKEEVPKRKIKRKL
ncbi:MAG: hypothetical protein ACFE9Q_02545 [Candidatus Hodarchaeota archaeon]